MQELQERLVRISDNHYLNGSKHDSDVIDSVTNIVRNQYVKEEKDQIINAFLAGLNETGPEPYVKALSYYESKFNS